MNSGECRVKNNILHALQTLFEPGDVVELRVPKTRQGTICGYFDDFDALTEHAADLDRTVESIGGASIYVTLNTVDTKLIARCKNRIKYKVDQTTGDHNIIRRRWLLVDFDPIRPAGISSTQAEHAAALQHSKDAARWLSETHGWPQPILADSGNGAHLLYRIELPNDDESKRLVEAVLSALDFRFGSEDISIDTAVGNASRIIKLYGTIARKGDNTPERPHRTSKLLNCPSTVGIVSVDQLKAVAAIVPTPEATVRSPKSSSFDLRSWLRDHKVPVGPEQPWNGGSKWIFEECPFNEEHKRTACIVMFANGAIAAGCIIIHVRSTSGRTFADTMNPTLMLMPTARSDLPASTLSVRRQCPKKIQGL